MKYLNVKSCRSFVNDSGKQISKQALYELDVHIQELLEKAIKIHNGGRSRIDETVIKFIIKKL